MNLREIKLGWYLLVFLLLYSLVVTVLWQRNRQKLSSVNTNIIVSETETPVANDGNTQAAVNTAVSSLAPAGLWFPIAGAGVPRSEAYLPGAPRVYRNGINQGFDFYGQDAGIPIPYGTPVLAAADGVVARVDDIYSELSPDEWQNLLAEVKANDVTAVQLDRLRGRQIWINTDDKLTLRYAHLSRIRAGLAEGQRVYRGQVIGYVGNSGTDDGVRGTNGGARLHFEIWQDNAFFGQDMDSESLRVRAASLFVGP